MMVCDKSSKWKPRKVCLDRDYPPGCGTRATPFILKADEHGASNNFEIDNSEVNGTVNAGDGCQFRQSETRPVGLVDIIGSLDVPVEKLTKFGDEVEDCVMETLERDARKVDNLEGRNSEIGNSVTPGGEEIPRTALMGVEIGISGTDGTLNAGWKLRKVYADRDFPPGK